ncbi:MAG: GNAT family N-acetyltransferase [Enterococcus sp.]
MEAKFRFADEQDLPPIVRIYNQAVVTRKSTADLEQIDVSERTEWFLQHSRNKRPIWVIELDEKVVGWISLTNFYGRIAYQETAEISIYIDREYQEKKLGHCALYFVEQQVDQLGIKTILAFIFGHNQASQHLFKQHGYQQWGHLPNVAKLDEQICDLDILGKSYS